MNPFGGLIIQRCLFFHYQVPSVAKQVVRAVAMASLATVCGLMEQEVTDMRSESISVLKLVTDYFYSPLSSSLHSQTLLGNFNKRLLKPQAVDCSRLVDMNYMKLYYIIKYCKYQRGLIRNMCLSSFNSDVEVQSALLQDWGRIAANFMRDQWICLSFLIKATATAEVSKVPETLRAALSCSVEALALLPSDLVLPVLTFMKTTLPQVRHSLTQSVSVKAKQLK